MPHPGSAATKLKFEGKNRELDQEFRSYVETFVEEIADPSRLSPKSSSNKAMTGREILNLICSCDQIFEQQIFESKSVIKANEKAHYAAKYEEAYAEYSKYLDQNAKDAEDLDHLERIHQETMQRAIKKFNATDPKTSVEDEYLKHLVEKCEGNAKLHKDILTARLEAKRLEQEAAVRDAVLDYHQKMENFIMDEDFNCRHEQCFAEISEKYQKLADLSILEKEVLIAYEKLRPENEKLRRKLEEAEAETRWKDLHVLVSVTLAQLSRNRWKQELEIVRDEDEMKEANSMIQSEVNETFWKSVLTKEENKYFEKLKEQVRHGVDEMKKETKRKNAIVSLPFWKKKKDQTAASSSRTEYSEDWHGGKLSGYVDDVYGQFILDLRSKLESGENDSVEQTTAYYEMWCLQKFACLCSEHIQASFDDLAETLKGEYKLAQEKNEENWILVTALLRRAIEDALLWEEKDWQKIMADRHIEEEVIEDHFQKAMRDELAVDCLLSSCSKAEGSKRVEEEVTKMMEDEAKRVCEKLKAENELNKEKRAVVCSRQTPSRPWYEDCCVVL